MSYHPLRHQRALRAVAVLEQSLGIGGVEYWNSGGEAEIFVHRESRSKMSIFRVDSAEDNAAMSLWIKRHPLPHPSLPRIHGLYRIVLDEDETVFVTHREELPDPPPELQSTIAQIMHNLEASLWGDVFCMGGGEDKPNLDAFARFASEASAQLRGRGFAKDEIAFQQVVSLHKWAARHGIGLHDAGFHNFGWRHGRMVMRDFGCVRPWDRQSPEWWAWSKIESMAQEFKAP